MISVERSWDEKAGPVAPRSGKGRRRVPSSRRCGGCCWSTSCARAGRGDFVFGRAADAPFTATHIRKRALAAWEREHAKRTEQGRPLLAPIKLHELRHSFVSLMHDAGFSPERIGDYVGHSTAYMTDAYRHLLDGHEAEAAERFEDYLTRATTSTLTF